MFRAGRARRALERLERLKLPPKFTKHCHNQAKKSLGRPRKNRLLQALTYEQIMMEPTLAGTYF
jgi:hypothetical protein